MKKIFSCLCIIFFIILTSAAVKANAQITEEKDIPEGYVPIYTIEDLYGINDDIDGNYILMADIDMSETAEGGDWDFGYGWEPINFAGVFEGNGHKIMNLNIFGDTPSGYAGVFGENWGRIANLGVENVDINISSPSICGGIAGVNYGGSGASDTYIGDTLLTDDSYGGILGCYATGSIINTCNVDGYLWGYTAGGITGYNKGRVVDCYSSVSVEADTAGGIFGTLHAWSYLCYSTSDVSGDNAAPIYGDKSWGGVENVVFLKTLGTQTEAKALSKAQMKLQKCYVGFDFDKVWFIDKNSPYPYPQLQNCPQVRTESIEIKSLPNKLVYALDDKLDLEGAELIINYEDDYSVTVPIEASMCTYKWKKGKQTVIVSYNGCTDEFEISVGEGKDTLTVTAEVSKLEVGDSFRFKAKYTGGEKIAFKSSNKKILSINKSTGKAKAKKAGTVTITISAGSLKEEIKVKVTK